MTIFERIVAGEHVDPREIWEQNARMAIGLARIISEKSCTPDDPCKTKNCTHNSPAAIDSFLRHAANLQAELLEMDE